MTPGERHATDATGFTVGPRAGLTAGAGLLLLGLVVFGEALVLLPLGGENWYILWWVAQAPMSALIRLDPAIYPEWRPLPYQSIWLEYQMLGLEHPSTYFAINLLLWVASAWFVYGLVVRTTASQPAAIVAGALVLVDSRAVSATAWIVERQSSMACVFGLAALLVVLGARRPLSRAVWLSVVLLLLASALSKEYGLAVALALVIHSLFERRRDVLGAAAVACLAYAGLRLSLVGGATASRYCEDMGYFFQIRRHCYDHVGAADIAQAIYNVVATVIGSLLPGLLTGNGQIGIERTRLALGGVMLALAVVGWTKGSQAVRVGLWMILTTAALSFLLYRGRNQLIALCGAGVAAGAGLAWVDERVTTWPRAEVWRAAISVSLAAMLVLQAARTRERTAREISTLLTQAP